MPRRKRQVWGRRRQPRGVRKCHWHSVFSVLPVADRLASAPPDLPFTAGTYCTSRGSYLSYFAACLRLLGLADALALLGDAANNLSFFPYLACVTLFPNEPLGRSHRALHRRVLRGHRLPPDYRNRASSDVRPADHRTASRSTPTLVVLLLLTMLVKANPKNSTGAGQSGVQ